MNIVALSDSHTRPLEELIRRVEFDLLLVLGDFDSVEQMLEIMELQQRYNERMIVVPGNHEQAVYKGKVISFDGTISLFMNKIILDVFRQKLEKDPAVKAFLENLMYQHSHEMTLDSTRFGNIFNTLVIHGALDGNPGSYHTDEPELGAMELWYRLRSRGDHEKNFARMRERGLNVMIRGHDRMPEFAQQKNGDIVITNPAEALLDPRALQTITVGSYAHGHYVLINTNLFGQEKPLVRFEKI